METSPFGVSWGLCYISLEREETIKEVVFENEHNSKRENIKMNYAAEIIIILVKK